MPRLLSARCVVGALCALLTCAGVGCGDTTTQQPLRPETTLDAGDDASTPAEDASDTSDTSDTDAAAPDADAPDADPPAPAIFAPLYDLAATSDPAGFYDHPFPADVRRTPEGAPDLTTFYAPARVPLIPDMIPAVHRDIRGFSPQGAAYLRFAAPLDPATLEGNVALLDIDPSSPDYGLALPVDVQLRDAEGRFWRPNTVSILPKVGRPLRPGTTYAAIIRSGVRGVQGEPAARSDAFDALLEAAAPAGREAEWSALQPLRTWLAADGAGEADALLVATVFTTSNPAAELAHLRQWLYVNAAQPVAANWTLLRVDEGRGTANYAGTYEALDLLSGEPPFLSPGAGVILMDANGDPTAAEPLTLSFTLTVPLGEPPAGGWPVVQYAHGAGGDRSSFVRNEGAWAAEVGLAMISIDNPMHGDRDPAADRDFPLYLVGLATSNLPAGRDLYRHGVPDHIQLARLLKAGVTVPAEVAHTTQPIPLNADHLTWASHSMGSQIGTLLLTVEPHLESAFFSEGGGSLTTAFIGRKANDVDILALVASALGVDLETEPLDAAHPVVSLVLQTLLDPADPLNVAPFAIREPRYRDTPAHLLMTEGMEDPQTLPPTIEALAATYGLPPVEPVAAFPDAHRLWGLDASQPTPASLNITLGPAPASGGLLQFPDQGHFPLYRTDEGKAWFQGWLQSAATGTPVIVTP